MRARHIGDALNVDVMDFGSFWVTGLIADGTVVAADSYGLAYVLDGIHLPEHVKMATAHESIAPAERATWATWTSRAGAAATTSSCTPSSPHIRLTRPAAPVRLPRRRHHHHGDSVVV